ncbi:type II toxin-antitoxin system HicA family toxin [Leptospira wolffii]|uniref:type II toxin-antitoxin system HicA family toxin n=1 Tax=Leptospira wolffii TaxID=409998 RepID=UPI0002FF30BA|nr:type II toxin-antitoxin system HicA family toxin [Leptospira wolffii]EPG64411.1 YcfA-like protein [Leptospira wolffii serovar Khorat str. Khorat-H2]
MSLSTATYREVKRKLEKIGFRQISQRGSHVKFSKSSPDGLLTVIVRTMERYRSVLYEVF